jgi:hypothetical protein
VPRLDAERARELGRLGGQAKAAKRLTLERVEADLPKMESPEAIVRRLEIISAWASAGMISGTVAHACVRSCEVGLKAFETRLSREIVEKLRARLKELEGQMRERKVG